MKIGVDIDEIITEYMKSFLVFLRKEKNLSGEYKDLFTYEFEKCFEISKDEMKDYVREHTGLELTLIELKLVEGALEAVNFLDDNHEILFITSRHIDNKEKTFTFFKKHFPEKEFKIIFSGDLLGDNKSKAELCKENGCELMVEDNLDYALDCVSKGVQVILMDKPWNKSGKIHENLIRVENWKEALEKIKEIENEY